MNILDHAPEWAHKWCYFFALTGIIAWFTAIAFIVMVILKMIPMQQGFTTAAILLVNGATTLTLFWMCRRTLA